MSDMISIQLYTLRSLGDVDVILDTVAAAGYKNVEGIGSHLDDAAVVAPKVAARGMKMTSSHVGLLALRERPDAVIDACKTFGFTDLYMPAVPPEMRQMDAAGWRAVGKELGDFTERFAKAGIHLGYHNHHWEMDKKDGDKIALELLFEAAGSSGLAWEVDVAWLVRGNADPKDGSSATSPSSPPPTSRTSRRPVRTWSRTAGPMSAPACSTGKIFGPPASAAGARHMVVEHDKPADPAQSVRASLGYLRSIAG